MNIGCKYLYGTAGEGVKQIYLSGILISSCKELSSVKLTNRVQKALEVTGDSWMCGNYFPLLHPAMSAVPIEIREIVIIS